MTHRLSPSFVAQVEIDLGLTYSLSNPRLAYECFTTALSAAIEAKRPDLAYRANELASIVR